MSDRPAAHSADRAAASGGGVASPPIRSGSRLAVPPNEQDHARGPADARVTLVEYGDYECPYCGRAHPILNRLLREMGDRLRLVYRHFPLNSIHEHAGIAAQAAEAAGAQGKFWAMHDLLFENQTDLALTHLHQHALKLGLEIERFRADLARETYVARIRADFRGGVRSGVNRTPAFFINGARYDGPLGYRPIRRAINAAGGSNTANSAGGNVEPE